MSTLFIGLYLMIYTPKCKKCENKCNQEIDQQEYNLSYCKKPENKSSKECENYTNCIDACNKEECFIKDKLQISKYKILYNVYIAGLVFQIISIIVLLSAYITMFFNLSDKEIREGACKSYYIVDYFRSPQKYLFVTTIILLFVCTFIQSIISLNMVSWYAHLKKKQNMANHKYEKYEKWFDYTDYSIYCKSVSRCEKINQSENTCSDLYKCRIDRNSFNYTGRCDYLSEYIYKCELNGDDYYCERLDECKNISQYQNKNNCTKWDDCPNVSVFYYYGYCDYDRNYYYNCSRNSKYFDREFWKDSFECNKISRCDEPEKYENEHKCEYWRGCYYSNFIYTSYCGYYSDDIYECDKVDVYYDGSCLSSFIMHIVVSVFGLLISITVIVCFIISRTLLKGRFFVKLLEIPLTRNIAHSIPSFIYPCLILYIFYRLIFPEYEIEYCSYNSLTLIIGFICIFQIIAILIFVIGICFVKFNRSDLDIIENSSELNRPLVRNS